ncbi:stage III sporulation protein AG [Clostridium sp. DSM 100503]|uniref:stage III sporulation protein AG n=1 Tax=Clostridium sp. DSM 100503 TaxID=2963282 RepID=UPI002149E7A3|nr:stage III sporulation protein AG [Clostridium sp. DSM 100503]MCR1949750.1 stage III sporulation protein AG [Clostridium sp. DSM 100503]
MGKGDWKKELANVINDKKFLNAVCIALVLAFVLLAISFLTTGRKKETKPTSVNTTTQNSSDLQNQSDEIIDSYEAQEKKELKNLLTKIENVGEVEVMIYFKSGEVKVPATENTTQEATTEETDNQGGKRTNTQQTDGSKVVMAGDGSKNEPYILQTNKPEISGVVIVAEGASSSKVKYDIQVAVSSLYGISIDKVNVYPMKN